MQQATDCWKLSYTAQALLLEVNSCLYSRKGTMANPERGDELADPYKRRLHVQLTALMMIIFAMIYGVITH